MKNSSVATLVRNQFNVPPEIDIKVCCESYSEVGSSKTYHFTVIWWEEDIQNTISVDMPHLVVRTKNFSQKP